MWISELKTGWCVFVNEQNPEIILDMFYWTVCWKQRGPAVQSVGIEELWRPWTSNLIFLLFWLLYASAEIMTSWLGCFGGAQWLLEALGVDLDMAQERLSSYFDLSQHSILKGSPLLIALEVHHSVFPHLSGISCFWFVWATIGPASYAPTRWFPKQPWTIAGWVWEHVIFLNLQNSIRNTRRRAMLPPSRHDFSPGRTLEGAQRNCKWRGSCRPCNSEKEKIFRGVGGKGSQIIFLKNMNSPLAEQVEINP